MGRHIIVADQASVPTELWLGLDNLLAPFELISAVLVYQPVWDRRIAQSFGHVPHAVQAVVLLTDGRVLPSRRSLADIHTRWLEWQQRQSSASEPPRSCGARADEHQCS